MDPRQQQEQARQERRARNRAVNEWRRHDASGTEKAWAAKSRSLADLVPKVWEHLRLDQRLAESQLLLVWKQVIDPAVVQHAQPVGLVKGTLFVNVDSSVWLSEIVRYRRHEILERLQTAMGREVVKKISFRAG